MPDRREMLEEETEDVVATALDPGARALFADDMTEQYRNLMQALSVAVDSLDQPHSVTITGNLLVPTTRLYQLVGMSSGLR